MSQSNIERALIQAYENGGFDLSTAFENDEFTPPSTPPWAEFYFIPNQPSPATAGPNGRDAHDGIVQVSLYYPLRSGKGAAINKADEITAHFKAGSAFTYNSVKARVRSSGYGRGQNENGFFKLIITINWYAHIAR